MGIPHEYPAEALRSSITKGTLFRPDFVGEGVASNAPRKKNSLNPKP